MGKGLLENQFIEDMKNVATYFKNLYNYSFQAIINSGKMLLPFEYSKLIIHAHRNAPLFLSLCHICWHNFTPANTRLQLYVSNKIYDSKI